MTEDFANEYSSTQAKIREKENEFRISPKKFRGSAKDENLER